MGVIIADVIVSAVTTLIAGVGAVALIENDSQAAVLAVYITPPAAILAGTYIASGIDGVRANLRCERGKERAIEEWHAEQSRERPRTTARQPTRGNVVGDKPLYCAITGPDVGVCFFDQARCDAAAETRGGSCEVRTHGWCFDAADLHGLKQTTCTASRLDCDARRALFTSDGTLTVTTCGTYAVAVPELSGT